jgi:glutathione S-transferase
MAYTLVIGNKNYSSGSLRPWLLMREAGIAFEEIRLPLYGPESRERILQYSPSGKVPCLVDGPLRVWDSLAIAEYLAERHPSLHLWPQDPAQRAVARAVSCEMHSGFATLRSKMPMNCRGSFPDGGRSVEVSADIDRIQAIWTDCRMRHRDAGPFLFGAFGIADAMFAPVVLRFRTYAVSLQALSQEYAEAVLRLPALQQWVADARVESEVIAAFEARP